MVDQLSDQAISTIQALVEKAAPHRLEITENLGKQMKFLRQSFVLHFVKDIDKKKDKEQYVETKVEAEKTFRKVVDYMQYEGGSSSDPTYDGLNKLEKILTEVNTIIQYLRYTEHVENLDSILAQLGMKIETRKLEATNQDLADPEVKDNISKVLASAVSSKTSVDDENSSIKSGIYDELPEELKYDSKTNKAGLKPADFGKLTNLEALKQKSEELAENKLESLRDSTLNMINSKMNVQAVAQTIAGTSEE